MMTNINLDDPTTFTKFDAEDMRGSIALLYKQVEQTWNEVSSLPLPDSLTDFSSIVFSGMGGSSLGAYIAKNLYSPSMKMTFEIINDYYIPEYVNEQTLVIIQSYSGTTEEALSALSKAQQKKAKIFTIATGNKLIENSKELNVPYFQINPLYNPCLQPRMGIGYSIFSLLTFLSRLKIIEISEPEVKKVIEVLVSNNNLFGINIAKDKNTAKQLARELHGKIPIFFGGEHLIGAIRATRNQFNENAKSMAYYFPLPEANHHVLEAFQFPENLREVIECVFYSSDHLSDNLKRRTEKTIELVSQTNIPTNKINLKGSTRLQEVMSFVHFGSYLGYYSAILNGIDPSPIPNVESFKVKS